MGYSITTELLNQCRGKTAAIIRGIFEDTFAKNFVMKKQDSEKMRFFMEMLARDGVPKKEGTYGSSFPIWKKRRFRQQLQLLQDNRVEKSSSNVRNSGIFCSVYLWRTRKKQVNPNRIFSGMQQKRSDVIRRSVW